MHYGLYNKNSQIPLDKYTATSYLKIGDTLEDIQKYLAMGFVIYTGAVQHCFILTGYDNSKNVLIAKNSLGPDWGPYGNGRFDIDYTDIGTLFSKYIIYNRQPMNMIFKDVSTLSPMAANIKRMRDLGLMRGFGTSDDPLQRLFMPEKPITRAEAAELMGNLIDKFGLKPL
jgi:hypothetical protein